MIEKWNLASNAAYELEIFQNIMKCPFSLWDVQSPGQRFSLDWLEF